MTTVAALFLLMDSVGKIVVAKPVVEATVEMGFGANQARGMGICLFLCLALHVFPPTALLGAVLLTAYLGGAVAAQVRVKSPWPTHALFPVYVGIFVWAGLCLREPTVMSLFW